MKIQPTFNKGITNYNTAVQNKDVNSYLFQTKSSYQEKGK